MRLIIVFASIAGINETILDRPLANTILS